MALTIAGLCAVTWTAHFLYFQNFLLSEDDYYHVGRALDADWNQISGILKRCFQHWPQGRPLHFALMPFFTYVGMSLGGLGWVYFFGYCFIAANTVLFFLLIKKIAPYPVAVAGALALGLFPADTSHIFITHSLALQASLMFLIAASLCYVSGYRILSYILIFGTLLTYETTITPFLAVPLLITPWNRQTPKRLGTVFFVVLGTIAIIIAVRLNLQELRMAGLFEKSLGQTIFRSLASMVWGPLVVAWAFLLRPVTAILNTDAKSLVLMAVFFTTGIFGFTRTRVGDNEKPIAPQISFKTRVMDISAKISLPAQSIHILQIFTAGFFALCLGYALTFTHWPPTNLEGRGTCIHLAATFGASMCFAAFVWFVLAMENLFSYKKISSGILALYLALLLGFCVFVQNNFVKSAHIQRDLWKQVLETCPDLEDSTRIFVQENIQTRNKFVISHSWTTRLVLDKLFFFPENWKSAPSLFIFDNKIWGNIFYEKDQDIYKLKMPWEPEKTIQLQPGNVILLELGKKGLVRLDADDIPGLEIFKNFRLKPKGRPTIQLFKKRALYKYMID